MSKQALEVRIIPLLTGDEELLWCGAPVARWPHARPHIKTALFATPLALLILALFLSALFGGDTATNAAIDEAEGTSNAILWVFGLFGFVVFIQVFKPLFYAAIAPKIAYGLTNHRVISINKMTGEDLEFFPLEEVRDVKHVQNDDGSANLIVAELPPKVLSLDRSTKIVGFIGIEGADELLEKLEAARKLRYKEQYG